MPEYEQDNWHNRIFSPLFTSNMHKIRTIGYTNIGGLIPLRYWLNSIFFRITYQRLYRIVLYSKATKFNSYIEYNVVKVQVKCISMNRIIDFTKVEWKPSTSTNGFSLFISAKKEQQNSILLIILFACEGYLYQEVTLVLFNDSY